MVHPSSFKELLPTWKCPVCYTWSASHGWNPPHFYTQAFILLLSFTLFIFNHRICSVPLFLHYHQSFNSANEVFPSLLRSNNFIVLFNSSSEVNGDPNSTANLLICSSMFYVLCIYFISSFGFYYFLKISVITLC